MKDVLKKCFDCFDWGYNRSHFESENIWLCKQCNDIRLKEELEDAWWFAIK
jgi:hypothetical protein